METRSPPARPVVPAVEGEVCPELPRWAVTWGAPDRTPESWDLLPAQ